MTDQGSLNKKHCIPSAGLVVRRYFQVGTAGTQESQSIFLAARSTYHLLIGLLALPQGTKEGKPERFCEVGRYSMPSVQELGRVGGGTEVSPILFLFQIRQGTWTHSDSALQVTCNQQAVE